MARTQGGIPLGSSFELTSSVPVFANGEFPTEADLLAADQLRHPSWPLRVVATGARYFIKEKAECFLVDGITPVNDSQWGTLLAHYVPQGASLPAQSGATAGKVLKSDGTNASWETDEVGTNGLADGSVTDAKLATDNKVGSLSALRTALGAFANGFTSVQHFLADLYTKLGNKVDAVAGKQLSTEDYTSAEKTKLGQLTVRPLYTATGTNTDGSMTQKSVTDALLLKADKGGASMGAAMPLKFDKEYIYGTFASPATPITIDSTNAVPGTVVNFTYTTDATAVVLPTTNTSGAAISIARVRGQFKTGVTHIVYVRCITSTVFHMAIAIPQ